MQLTIPSDLEHLILEKAAALGYPTAESYLRSVVGTTANGNRGNNISAQEFERLLDELADEDVPTLPDDFSRADIYGDHP